MQEQTSEIISGAKISHKFATTSLLNLQPSEGTEIKMFLYQAEVRMLAL
jgi:hypothetical protein